ncbi:MAG: contractile injection system tape measure protein [Bacteroidota bacterium]
MNSYINAVRFEVLCSDEKLSRPIQDKIFGICRYELSSALDKIITERHSIRKESLSIDIGNIPFDSLDAQLIPKILSHVEEWIKKNQDDQAEIKSNNELDVVILHLEKGLKHWTFNVSVGFPAYLHLAVHKHWSKFRAFLYTTRYLEGVALRIVNLASNKCFEELVEKLQPTEAVFTLGFIEDVQKIGKESKRIFEASDIDTSVRYLAVLDLIREHGSFFNRKMFVKRQLYALALHYRLDYAEVLTYFRNVIYSKELHLQFRTSLPALIDQLIHESITRPENWDVEDLNGNWELVFNSNLSGTEQETVQLHWSSWILNYTGEMRASVIKNVKSQKLIQALISNLSLAQIDDLIKLIEPIEYAFIHDFHEKFVTKNTQETFIKQSEKSLRQSLNEFILGFILLDHGSRFNKKQFVNYQLRRISNRYNVSFIDVLHLLIDTEEESSKGSSSLKSILIEIKRERSRKYISTSYKVRQIDSLELFKQYMLGGGINWLIATHLSLDEIKKELRKVLSVSYLEKEVMVFFETKRDKIRLNDPFGMDFYHMVVAWLIKRKTTVSLKEGEELVQIVSFEAKKHSAGLSYIQEVIQLLISFKTLTRIDLIVHRISEYDKSASKTFRYLKSRFSEVATSKNEHQTFTKPTENSRDQVLRLLVHARPNSEVWKKSLEVALSKLRATGELNKFLAELKRNEIKTMLSKVSNEGFEIIRESLFDRLPFLRKIHEQHPLKPKTSAWILFWTQIILSKGAERKIKKALESIDGTISVSRIPKIKQEGHITFEQLKKYLITGKLNSYSQMEYEREMILLFSKRDPQWNNFLNYHPIQKYLKQWASELHTSVLIRIIQHYLRGQFNNFMSMTEDAEKLLMHELPANYSEQLIESKVWYYRIHYAYLFASGHIRWTHLMNHYLDLTMEVFDDPSIHPAFISNLIKTKKEIGVASLRKKAEQIIQAYEEGTSSSDEMVEVLIQETPRSFQINNSGLVLLWPYFTRLFSLLKLTNDENKLINVESQNRAANVLQFAATGEDNQPEYEMTLNKVLCGIPLAQPLTAVDDLNREEIDLINSMIEGAVANWGTLGETSVEGFRNTFLLRTGSLAKDDPDWILRVDKMGVDVLFKTIPWGYSSIKLPWMKELLNVSWV